MHHIILFTAQRRRENTARLVRRLVEDVCKHKTKNIFFSFLTREWSRVPRIQLPENSPRFVTFKSESPRFTKRELIFYTDVSAAVSLLQKLPSRAYCKK